MAHHRIAILADIHGNLPALEAVLEDIAAVGVDEILVGGDLVGRGPQGSAVVRRVRELGLATIGGNHEDYLLGFRRREVPEEWWHQEEWAASRFMAAELEESVVEHIASLPFSLARDTLRLVHGTPESNRQAIGPWTSRDELSEHLAAVEEPVLVCAHTHRALVAELDHGLVVNVGSVGLPFNRDPRAQYALFHRGGPHGWRPELRQVPYDREQMFALYESTGFLEKGGITAQLLRMELEHATPVLVPFLEWASAKGVEARMQNLPRFLGVFNPEEPLRKFFARLDGED
jgi:predicted phosphodiesterase